MNHEQTKRHTTSDPITRGQFLHGALAAALAAPLLGPGSALGAAKSPTDGQSGNYAANVRDFGATGDGVTKDHRAIQRAIDGCAERGGGTVWVPAGTYLCGTIELKSNIHFHLDAGAVIAGSPDREDYRKILEGNQFHTGNPSQPANHDQFLIVANKAANVSIAGPGMVDGRGHHFYDTANVKPPVPGMRSTFRVKRWRPGPAVAFLFCQDVALSEITILNNPFFAVFMHGCSSARIISIRILTDRRFQNADGIHVACARGLTITGCQVDSEDDALCFYTNYWGLPGTDPDCSGITVSNCVLSSACCGIRVGFGADGRLSDMVFSNVVVNEANRGIDFVCNANNFYQRTTSPAGPSIQNLIFSNFVIAKANWGITGNIQNDANPPAGIRDILYTGVQVHSGRGNYLVGSKNIPVRGITFRDVDFTVTGSIENVPDVIPDPLGIFAAAIIPHGFFLRHADDVAFRDCRIRWDGARGDWRSGLHVADGRQIDCRTLRVDPLREGWGSGITSAHSKLL